MGKGGCRRGQPCLQWPDKFVQPDQTAVYVPGRVSHDGALNVVIFITDGPQPSPVPRTLCVLPSAPASSNAAAPTTTTGTSASGRSVLKKNAL